MHPILHRLRRFRDEEDGIIMAEFLLLLPLLIWAFLALFIYWDAFRTINESQKASYAVADLISRQNDVPLSFVNGMDDVMEMMITNSPNVKVRITSVEWDRDDNRHYVLFSRSPGNEMPSLTTAQMVPLRGKIPIMADHDSVVIVETETDYKPLFDVGIAPQTFTNFVVTRPRFYRRICLIEQPCPATM
ncbi:TadE/TadG family type IV pilus assembly protein [Neotabrizicola sp. VNH66]|uniref:TadE/TadG family type IV pilus assembly protein n=1 Tax=Neotabrizicola sp. VNH66 TaxID=3400918 RepID=UPI003C0BB29B